MAKSKSSSPSSVTINQIIDAAGPIFASKGFHATTVREITQRAKVNIAAVNYHFRDKHELYVNVLKHAHHAGRGMAKMQFLGDPTARLYTFIRLFLGYLLDPHRPEWHGRLIAREMADPSQALDRLVKESILPIKEQIYEIVRDLAGPKVPEARVRQACFSVIGQCLYYIHCQEMIARLFPMERNTRRDIDALADHVFEFSLAGINAITSKSSTTKKRPPFSPITFKRKKSS